MLRSPVARAFNAISAVIPSGRSDINPVKGFFEADEPHDVEAWDGAVSSAVVVEPSSDVVAKSCDMLLPLALIELMGIARDPGALGYGEINTNLIKNYQGKEINYF